MDKFTFIQRYSQMPGDTQRVLSAIWTALSGGTEAVEWSSFTSSDWELFLHIAHNEGVAPLLYRALSGSRAGEFAGLSIAEHQDNAAEQREPANFRAFEPVRQALSTAYYTNVARNMRLFHELDRVLAALSEYGIPVVLLKGAALAGRLYEDAGLRIMGDLDLLIPKERLSEAIARVESLGYSTEDHWRYPETRPGQRMLTFFEANLNGGQDGQTHVELHWGLVAAEASLYHPRVDWFWQHTLTHRTESGIPNSQFLILDPTANLLFLCAHLALKHILYKHGDDCTHLRWYYDLHLLITKHGAEIDWDEVLRRGQEFRWIYALQEALRDTVAFFGTPVPVDFMKRLQQYDDPAARRLLRRLQNPQKSRFSTSMDDYALMPVKTKFWLALSVLFPSRAYLVQRYQPRPELLWPLCYPYRWFVISLDLLKTLFAAA